MIVGIPREVKEGEKRVALLPEAVEEVVAAGHDVRVETRAGEGAGVSDDAYRDAGADVVTARDAWDADLVVKVKEMLPPDLAHTHPGLAVFSFHQLPSMPERTRALAQRGLTAIDWLAMHDARGRFPLLAPMSRIAGRMAIDVARRTLGRAPRRVLVLGGGEAGRAAARAARLAGAEVVLLTRSEETRDALRQDGYAADLAAPEAVEREALAADLVVGAVFRRGLPTPKLLPRALVARMQRGAMLVDICIEEGGVAETSRRTTHAEPTYVEEGVIHYCVGNMPAARPGEASLEISRAALPYVLDLANLGIAGALSTNAELRSGLLLWEGRVAVEAIAREAGLAFAPPTAAELAQAREAEA